MINRAGVDEGGRDKVQCCCKLGVKNFMGCTRKVELKGSCMALRGEGNNFEKKFRFAAQKMKTSIP